MFRSLVLSVIEEAERLFNCKVLLATDVGSRAWGYCRDGSDYDVHCCFVHHPSSLLGVVPPSDLLSHSRDNVNLSGTSLRKVLGSISRHGSGVDLFEMLQSPIQYYLPPEAQPTVEVLRTFAFRSFSARRCVHGLVANFDKNFTARVLGQSTLQAKFYLQYVRLLKLAQLVGTLNLWPDQVPSLYHEHLPELHLLWKWRTSLPPGSLERIGRSCKLEIWLLLLRASALSAVCGVPDTYAKVSGPTADQVHIRCLCDVWGLVGEIARMPGGDSEGTRSSVCPVCSVLVAADGTPTVKVHWANL